MNNEYFVVSPLECFDSRYNRRSQCLVGSCGR